MGLSPSAWDVEVASGRLPKPVQVTSGVKGWDKHDLDDWIEARKEAQATVANPWDDA